MKRITIHAARAHLSRLIKAVLDGEEVVIAKRGKPVVRLVPVQRRLFEVGLLAGRLGTVPNFLAPMSVSELDLWEAGTG